MCVRGKVERERDKKREGGGNDLRDYWPKGMSCQDSPAYKNSIVPLVVASHSPHRQEYSARLIIYQSEILNLRYYLQLQTGLVGLSIIPLLSCVS